MPRGTLGDRLPQDVCDTLESHLMKVSQLSQELQSSRDIAVNQFTGVYAVLVLCPNYITCKFQSWMLIWLSYANVRRISNAYSHMYMDLFSESHESLFFRES